MNPYEELEVAPDADAKTIKRAYRRLSAANHPDRAKDDADRAARTERMSRLNRANDILNDAAARARFDKTGSADVDPKQGAIDLAISAMFTAMIDTPYDIEADDLIDRMKDVSSRREISLHNSIVDLERRITRRRRALRRLKRVDGGKNAIAEAVEKQIAKSEEEIAVARSDIEFAQLVRKELESYSYETGSPFDSLFTQLSAPVAVGIER